MADNPYAEFEEYARQAQTLAGNSIGTPEEEAERTARSRARAAANERYQGMGGARRGMAGVRNIVSAIPIVRNIPGISGFANPPSGSEAAMDLEDARTARPGLSSVERFVGGVGPYAGAASAAPRLLYGTLPRAMGSNAAIGAMDARLAGENPMLAAGRDALSTIPGAVAGRMFAPRNQAAAMATRRERLDSRARLTDEAIDDAIDAGNAMWGRIAQTHAGPGRPPGSSSTPYADAADDLMAQAERMRARLAEFERAQNQAPTMTIPPIGDRASGKLENTIRDAMQGAVLAMLGAGAGQSAGMNPMWPAAAGMAAPMVGRMAVDRANNMITGFNRNFLGENAPALPRRAIWQWLNNPKLSDTNRSMLRALGPPAVQEYGDEAGEFLSPRMVDILAGPLGGRQNAPQ